MLEETEENLTIKDLKGGAAIEMADLLLQKIYDDIADPNKEPKSKREMSLKVIFAPTEDATFGTCKVVGKTVLGKQREIEATVYFGAKKGRGICSELKRDLPLFNESEGAEQ